MRYQKLSTGFLVTDFEESKISSGLLRLAPKILQYGAEQLARSATYMFALHKLEVAGASAAINSKPETRQEHISKFINEVAGLNFLPDAAKGISDDELTGLKDSRPATRLTEIGGQKLYQYCTGVSAVATIDELMGGLEKKTVAIEGFSSASYGAIKSLEKLGAKVVGVSNQKDFVHLESGFDYNHLCNSWEQHGDGFLQHINSDGGDTKPAEEIFKIPVDILFVGSKMGIVDHTLDLDVAALVSLHPIAYTAKALITLERKGVIIPPDFLCLGGQLEASWGSSTTPDETIKLADQKARELTREIDASKEAITDGPKLFLAACKMAEDFILTWQPKLPFGRALG